LPTSTVNYVTLDAGLTLALECLTLEVETIILIYAYSTLAVESSLICPLTSNHLIIINLINFF